MEEWSGKDKVQPNGSVRRFAISYASAQIHLGNTLRLTALDPTRYGVVAELVKLTRKLLTDALDAVPPHVREEIRLMYARLEPGPFDDGARS